MHGRGAVGIGHLSYYTAMITLIHLLEQYGVLIVFAIVLIEQIGMPIPALPILIVAGALSVDGDMNRWSVWTVALLACAISDGLWFGAGRRYGKHILKLLCRISLSPDYCVSQTEDNFNRWGPKALVVSKFIPGFNTIAAPMSGAMGIGFNRFFGFALVGSLLWSGVGILLGVVFHKSVDHLLATLSTMGATALVVLAGLLALFISYKYMERVRFRQAMQVERISVDELIELMAGDHQPVLLDARSHTAQQLEAAIPGALLFNHVDSALLIEKLDKGRQIIVYCSCPNDVTAASVAKQLHQRGYHSARPLHGGLEAWNAVRRARREQARDVAVRLV